MDIKLTHGIYKNCSLRFMNYVEGNGTSITVLDEYGNPLINATKNIPERKLSYNQVLIKDYAENAGILASLIENEILLFTGTKYHTGYVKLHLCELLVDPKTYNEEQSK